LVFGLVTSKSTPLLLKARVPCQMAAELPAAAVVLDVGGSSLASSDVVAPLVGRTADCSVGVLGAVLSGRVIW
jgi:hypothetical protein